MWNEFEDDKHTAGSFVRWKKMKLKVTIDIEEAINEVQGLEANIRTPMPTRRKR